MSDADAIHGIIVEAIFDANIADPIEGPGVTRGQVYRSREDSENQARQIVRRLQEAGYEIRRKPAPNA